MHSSAARIIRSLSVVLVATAAVACGGGDDNSTPTGPSTPRGEYSQVDLVVGTGTEATVGRNVTAYYTLWFYNPNGTDGKGQQIQSNVGGTPFPFLLGGNGVISGWNRGVPGMRVGGRRRLVLPPELAYGAAGNPPTIGPNATLVFEIELLSVQ
jgi:FKBP-type peptidyl-prolyl cis-trans isomerase